MGHGAGRRRLLDHNLNFNYFNHDDTQSCLPVPIRYYDNG